jgi:hypothetical protein
MVNSPARNALVKLLANHEWVEIRARDEACLFVQDLWANSKLQILDMDVSDSLDRSEQQNNDANLLFPALLHNTSLSSLTTFLDSQCNFRNALAAIGAEGFTSLKHLCLVGTIHVQYTEMLSILRALFSNLDNISLPDWWPGVARLIERRLESWSMLKTLAVGTVPPDNGAILDEIDVQGILLPATRCERGNYIPKHGMVFAKRPDPETYPRLPHIWHCLSRIQHTGVETLVINGVIMGTDFEWVQTALGSFPSLTLLKAVVLIAGATSLEISRQGLEIRLLLENKDWTTGTIETISQGAMAPFCELRKALDNSWKFNVVADWLGKVREDSFQITLEKQR